jgi:hypothetical protein
MAWMPIRIGLGLVAWLVVVLQAGMLGLAEGWAATLTLAMNAS